MKGLPISPRTLKEMELVGGAIIHDDDGGGSSGIWATISLNLCVLPPCRVRRNIYQSRIPNSSSFSSPSSSKVNVQTTTTEGAGNTPLPFASHLSSSQSITIEIKPKSPSPTMKLQTPFTPNNNKHRLQSLTTMRYHVVNHTRGRTSNFCPGKFFSPKYSEKYMNDIISKLVDTPNNNIKLFIDKVEMPVSDIVTHELPIVSIVSDILRKERRVIDLIYNAQGVDILGFEGMNVVYNRLLVICDGEKDEVFKNIDDRGRVWSGVEGGKEKYKQVDELVEYVDSFRDKLEELVSSDADEEIVNQFLGNAYETSMNMLTGFDFDSLLEVAVRFLIGLTFRDVSIMVCFEAVAVDADVDADSDIDTGVGERNQTGDVIDPCGILKLQEN